MENALLCILPCLFVCFVNEEMEDLLEIYFFLYLNRLIKINAHKFYLLHLISKVHVHIQTFFVQRNIFKSWTLYITSLFYLHRLPKLSSVVLFLLLLTRCMFWKKEIDKCVISLKLYQTNAENNKCMEHFPPT